MQWLAVNSGPASATAALVAAELQRMHEHLYSTAFSNKYKHRRRVQNQHAAVCTAPPPRPKFEHKTLLAPSLSLKSAAIKFGSNASAPAFSNTRANTLQFFASTCTADCCASSSGNNATVIATACSCVSLRKANGGAAPIKFTLLLQLQHTSVQNKRNQFKKRASNVQPKAVVCVQWMSVRRSIQHENKG
jgi:hypothetical protein